MSALFTLFFLFLFRFLFRFVSHFAITMPHSPTLHTLSFSCFVHCGARMNAHFISHHTFTPVHTPQPDKINTTTWSTTSPHAHPPQQTQHTRTKTMLHVCDTWCDMPQQQQQHSWHCQQQSQPLHTLTLTKKAVLLLFPSNTTPQQQQNTNAVLVFDLMQCVLDGTMQQQTRNGLSPTHNTQHIHNKHNPAQLVKHSWGHVRFGTTTNKGTQTQSMLHKFNCCCCCRGMKTQTNTMWVVLALVPIKHGLVCLETCWSCWKQQHNTTQHHLHVSH